MNYVEKRFSYYDPGMQKPIKSRHNSFHSKKQIKTSCNKIWGWQFWFLLTAMSSIWSLGVVLGKAWGTKRKNRDEKNSLKQSWGLKVFWDNFDYFQFWFLLNKPEKNLNKKWKYNVISGHSHITIKNYLYKLNVIYVKQYMST